MARRRSHLWLTGCLTFVLLGVVARLVTYREPGDRDKRAFELAVSR